MLSTPTDGFGPDLKAWIDATKLQDQESARKALLNLQRLRADRNLSSVDDVAAVISGRAEARGIEGSQSEAAEGLGSAAALDPGSASILVSKAAAEGKVQDAWGALSLSASNPFEAGRVRAFRLLTVLVIGGLFALGFALALLLRYAAVFSHDVSEGLPQALKSFSLAMAVLFLALPLAGLLGWGYLPFWWAALLFIFQSRAEKAVSLVLLVGLSLASLALPLITHQRAINAAASARLLHKVANGGISVEGEQLVKERLAQDPTDLDWSLLSASLSRRAGRFDEADALLQPRTGADPRFAHNAAALALNRGDFARALPGFAQAAEASLSPQDRATAFYNLSLAQVNTLAFDASKESRAKGDALDSQLLAGYDRLFSFDRDGSTLQAAPDIVPAAPRLMGAAIPNFAFTAENSLTRLTAISLACLLIIPAIMKLRGARSFSKQCPKCGTTFCWMCQTRSTSQDVCSQCHHLFVVKRGIPPATRAAKTAEISRFVALRSIQHRVASLLAPGSGHLSVGHFTFGIVILFVWALSVGVWLSVSSFAPQLLASGPVAPMLKNVFLGVAVLSYVAAQAVTPRPPVIVTPRRVREAEA
jgi:tetratricopeptide (TPR) repeat protein